MELYVNCDVYCSLSKKMKISLINIESVINAINTIYKKTAEKEIDNILQLQKFVL